MVMLMLAGLLASLAGGEWLLEFPFCIIHIHPLLMLLLS